MLRSLEYRKEANKQTVSLKSKIRIQQLWLQNFQLWNYIIPRNLLPAHFATTEVIGCLKCLLNCCTEKETAEKPESCEMKILVCDHQRHMCVNKVSR